MRFAVTPPICVSLAEPLPTRPPKRLTSPSTVRRALAAEEAGERAENARGTAPSERAERTQAIPELRLRGELLQGRAEAGERHEGERAPRRDVDERRRVALDVDLIAL